MSWNDYQPPRVKHVPLHPARESTPGEVIYLSLWREWATANPREWAAIFETTAPVRQRAASVAASFMVFMGCNGGRCFTEAAEKLAQQDHWSERAYLAAWANENKRNRGINSGLRTIEYMLAREYPIVNGPFGPRLDWKKVPAISMEDIDVVESMVRWWAGSTARVIREIAAPLIDAATRKQLSGLFNTPDNYTEETP